jgi:hypothetical protein
MLTIIPAWIGDGRYQLGITTDNAAVHTCSVYVVSYRQLYYVADVPPGQSEVELPAEIAYGAVMFHAIGMDASGAVVDIGPGHYTIHEANFRQSPFWVQLTRDEMAVVPYTENISGYRLRVSVTDAYGLPKKLFLFKLNRDWKYDVGDEFLGVCRPGDFDAYPEEQPEPEGIFFRKA